MAVGRDSSLGGDCGYGVRQYFGWRLVIGRDSILGGDWLKGETVFWMETGYRERQYFGWEAVAIG